ncbi:MAG TPA: hypothetical protein ACFYD3_02275 [Candidatus Hypogeohydataceae bacterium YC41]
MITLDAIALVVTVVLSVAGATYTIAKKLGGIEEKVNGLEKKFDGLEKKVDALEQKILDTRSELKADIKRLEDRIYDISKSLARIEAEFIKK